MCQAQNEVIDEQSAAQNEVNHNQNDVIDKQSASIQTLKSQIDAVKTTGKSVAQLSIY